MTRLSPIISIVFGEHEAVAIVGVGPHEGSGNDPVPHFIHEANTRGFSAISVRHVELGMDHCAFVFTLVPRTGAADA